jgi:hypothetical protein
MVCAQNFHLTHSLCEFEDCPENSVSNTFTKLGAILFIIRKGFFCKRQSFGALSLSLLWVVTIGASSIGLRLAYNMSKNHVRNSEILCHRKVYPQDL